MSLPVHIISLGAGKQSSAMALMTCHGLIKPMPACAIFADTGDEPDEVYSWLKELAKHLTFPIIQIKTGPLSDALVNKWGFSQLPTFIKTQTGVALGQRQCTRHFKIMPIRREIRARYPNTDCVLWIGISTDEATRAKDSGRKWLVHRHPLLEILKNRQDCDDYVFQHVGRRAPKSACCYCPYKDHARWVESLNSPQQMGIINKVESILNPRGEFLTSDLKPISEIDFSKSRKARREEQRDINAGQTNLFNLFENECEGICGV